VQKAPLTVWKATIVGSFLRNKGAGLLFLLVVILKRKTAIHQQSFILTYMPQNCPVSIKAIKYKKMDFLIKRSSFFYQRKHEHYI
jgi:hypothetical protein